MSNIKEITTSIEASAKAYADKIQLEHGHKKHLHTKTTARYGYIAGATEWAGKAQPVIDAVQGLLDEVDTEGLTQDRLEQLETALAKYKETIK
jgi:hypothetical protein